jgi:hypothetical protein
MGDHLTNSTQQLPALKEKPKDAVRPATKEKLKQLPFSGDNKLRLNSD